MEGKDLLLSENFWGVLLLVVSAIAKSRGWDIGDTNGWVTDILALIGLVMSIRGRARKDIKRITTIGGLKSIAGMKLPNADG